MSAAKPSAASVCAVDIVVGWYGLVRQQNGLVRDGFTSRGVTTFPAPPAAALTTGRWTSHAGHRTSWTVVGAACGTIVGCCGTR